MPQIAPLVAGDPRELGSFKLAGRIGEGGQGVVYLGENDQGERAAIKLLHIKFSGDKSARSRFARELKAAERVASFCTARVVEADLEGDTPYIASEYIDGRPLREVVESDGPLSGAKLDRLAIGTATALVAIHHASIVHRDFKPDNVLIAADGPRVVDFGIARIIDSTGTITSRAIGTPAYMAPEQISGDDVGPYTDVFAWGATIAFAATGQAVFEGTSIAVVLNRILNHEVDVSGIPQPLRGAVQAALTKEPGKRPTADQILLRLLGQPETHGADTAVLSQGAVLASDDTAPIPRQRLTVAEPSMPIPPPVPTVETAGPELPARQRRKGPWIGLALGVVLVVAAAVALVMQGVIPLTFSQRPTPAPTVPQEERFSSLADKVAKTGKIVIGVKADLPNIALEDKDTGVITGLEVELGRRIALALNPKADITFKPVARADRAKWLANGTVDLVIATYTVNDSDKVTFAGPYYLAHHDVLVADGAGIASAKDLEGKAICGQPSAAVGSLQDVLKDYKIVRGLDYGDCMNLLKSGAVHAVPGEDYLLAGFAQREPVRYRVLGLKMSDEPYGIGIRQGDVRTCKAINGIVSDLYSSGRMAKLMRQYFGKVRFEAETKQPTATPCD
ncbi:serine/threonine-protein kinase [Nonomuraea sp. NPDC050663]|uniref:serine/threonine-protein kinase n=1 Tax=Nonomuraea sp. NPDC050663 TaxID=3364370 RepID=UPI003792877E